jgi:GNAT superfamily N-acetyltransferase
MSNLRKLSDEQLAPLLIESTYAFLASKSSPNETASSLLEKFKNNKKYNTLGYIVNNHAVSYIVALSGRSDNEIAIGPMYVAESFRGSGLGKRQIMDFIQLYTEQGYESIYTKTWIGNTVSRHSFESTGFIEVDRTDNDRVDGDSTISYVLQIIRP